MRDKTFMMSGGNDVNYVFSYTGYPQTALDQLPKSTIKKNSDGSLYKDKDGGQIIEGHISHNGALMWVLSQGSKVKVKFPITLAQEVQENLTATLDRYSKHK